jgi:hypothetical protein
MWDKLRIRERERRLGILFVSVLAAVFGGGLVFLGFPPAGQAAVTAVLGLFWLRAVRRKLALRASQWGPAPVGPLSPDERAKARSKLVASRRPDWLAR